MNKQLKKEVLITLALYIFYFVWWYYFAYIYCPSNVEDYEYILGLPSWFFYSCVLGLVLINTLVYFCVKMFFKDFDLDAIENKKKKDGGNETNE